MRLDVRGGRWRGAGSRGTRGAGRGRWPWLAVVWALAAAPDAARADALPDAAHAEGAADAAHAAGAAGAAHAEGAVDAAHAAGAADPATDADADADAADPAPAVLLLVTGADGDARAALVEAARAALAGRARVLDAGAAACAADAPPCEGARQRALGRAAGAPWVVSLDVARVGGREAAAVEWREAGGEDAAPETDGALVSARAPGGLAAAVGAELSRVARTRLPGVEGEPGARAAPGGPEARPAPAEALGDPFARAADPAPAASSGGPPLYKRWWFWVGVAAVVAGVTVALSQGDDGPSGAEVQLVGPDPAAALARPPPPGPGAAGRAP